MRLMRRARDRAVTDGAIHGVASPAMATDLCQVFIGLQIIPTGREQIPIGKTARVLQQATHRGGLHEFEAIQPQRLREG